MSDQDEQHDDVEEVGDVDWQVDDDGTEWFLEDGVRYELAEDGFAYPVEASEAIAAAPDVVDTDDDVPAATSSPGSADDAGVGTGRESRRERRRREKAESADAAPADDAPSPFSEQGADTFTVNEPPREQASSDLPPPHDWGEGALLQLEGLRSGYGKLPVLHGVDLEINRGETAVMLGLNGAGKTTTAMNICGALGSWGGAIRFEGQDITAWGTRECVNAGIVMVPEGRRVFPDLTVDRNLQVGAWSQRGEKDWFGHQREVVFDYFPRLREREGQLAGTLSGGEQQMLAVGRGLMANPRMLIVDEASMGLAPVIVKDVFDIVAQISADGVTVLLIEQNVGALEVADVGFVMEQGRLVRTLRGDALTDRSQVTEILMG